MISYSCLWYNYNIIIIEVTTPFQCVPHLQAISCGIWIIATISISRMHWSIRWQHSYLDYCVSAYSSFGVETVSLPFSSKHPSPFASFLAGLSSSQVPLTFYHSFLHSYQFIQQFSCHIKLWLPSFSAWNFLSSILLPLRGGCHFTTSIS